MNSAVTKQEIESALVDRFGHVFERYERLPAETLSTGSEEIDDALQGFPRGAITEIHGTASSGRTSLILSALSAASSQDEICAVVDCDDTFDLSSAANAGVDFDRLLWIRCDHNLERAFKAVDLILHSGGFGFVALNLCDVPAMTLRRIVSSWWFRFRRAIENTPTAMIVLTPLAAVRSCASLALELNNKGAVWPSTLSLVSDNGYSRFTGGSETGSHLYLVTPPAQSRAVNPAHSQFLRSTSICINRTRPVQWQLPAVNFRPHLR
ncbi:MAG TPA: hypothetical protein VNG71_20880 [Pyrinomonadaceae bacterium]|nr:hypothetical protein [Pyrinomonadaceae bacterium]